MLNGLKEVLNGCGGNERNMRIEPYDKLFVGALQPDEEVDLRWDPELRDMYYVKLQAEEHLNKTVGDALRGGGRGFGVVRASSIWTGSGTASYRCGSLGLGIGDLDMVGELERTLMRVCRGIRELEQQRSHLRRSCR